MWSSGTIVGMTWADWAVRKAKIWKQRRPKRIQRILVSVKGLAALESAAAKILERLAKDDTLSGLFLFSGLENHKRA